METTENRLILDLVSVPMAVYVQWVDRPEAQVRQHLAILGVRVDDSIAKYSRVDLHAISNAMHRYLDRQR